MVKIIIVADLGHFRAYRVIRNKRESPRVELIESYDSVEAHGKLSEKLSDDAGRFGMSGGKNGSAKGYGEPHKMELEMQKKVIRLIAGDVDSIVAREGFPRWYLAAGEKINSQLIEYLGAEAKARLARNLTSNLTKVRAPELLARFE
jgi:hypothetical protein